MQTIRRAHGVQPVTVLQSEYSRKPWIVPIPGTTKLARLEENIGAVSVELTAEDLREIDRASSSIGVQGAAPAIPRAWKE